MSSIQFHYANTPVDRKKVHPDLIAQMADSAKNIKVAGNASADEWSKLAESVVQQDAVSAEQAAQIDQLGKATFKYHSKLHADFKASGYKDQAIKSELADVHVFRAGNDKIRKAVAYSQAMATLAAHAGAEFGPTGLVATYLAGASLKQEQAVELIRSVEDLRLGNSNLVHQGNQIEGYHAEQVWPKMVQMLQHGVAEAGAGRPLEVNAQYYELTSQQIVGLLAENAEAGNKVRVNVDAGRLVAYKGSHVVIDEVPDKLRAMLQLVATGGDVGISLYNVSEALGAPNNLMHRKGLRVGDEFFLSGMNANEGSGENIDAGYSLKGPVARQLVANFARDAQQSAGSSAEAIFGEKPLAEFMQGDINMGTRGLVSLFDLVHGPGKAGTSLPSLKTFAQLEKFAQSKGLNAGDFVDCDAAKAEELLAAGEALPLSKHGKEAFLTQLHKVVDLARSPENVARIQDISLPEGKVEGATAVALADHPVDRETLMLQAIQDAEEFIYIPGFVMTKTVAELLVAKKEEMEAQGKSIDIRVLADPGVYPDGGTPNQAGMEILEDAGIACRWANLPRTGWHDRKIHAKQILTDRGEFFGSTNFSRKGLRENWEHSAYVKFEDGDRQAGEARDEAKSKFLHMWDRESYELNSLERGRRLKSRDKEAKDYEILVDESRFGTVRDVIKLIETAEVDSGNFTEDQLKNPEIASRRDQLMSQGYDEGNAALIAVQEKMGSEAFYQAISELPGQKALREYR